MADTTKPLISLTYNEVAILFRTKKLSEDFISNVQEAYMGGRGLVKIIQGERTFAEYDIDVQELLGGEAAVEDFLLDIKQYLQNGVPLDLLNPQSPPTPK
jgi:hypothetical protein